LAGVRRGTTASRSTRVETRSRTGARTVERARTTCHRILAAATGLRRGELAGLRWSAVDLEGSTLVVSATRVVVGHEVVASGPKTEAGARTVSLDSVTVTALRQHRRRQLEERVAAGPAWEGDDELLFVDELGRPIHPARMTKLLAARARAAGLPPIHLHALRHGHATHGLQGGVPIAVMSKRLGHSSIRVTADTYSHLVPELDGAAADQVAALLDGASRQTS
jgi:integrase